MGDFGGWALTTIEPAGPPSPPEWDRGKQLKLRGLLEGRLGLWQAIENALVEKASSVARHRFRTLRVRQGGTRLTCFRPKEKAAQVAAF